MNLSHFRKSYIALSNGASPREHKVMVHLGECYLKGLFIIVCVLLKEPQFEHLSRMWQELPMPTTSPKIKAILSSIFNPSNIELNDLPEETQTQIATYLLQNKTPFPWAALTESVLRSVISTSPVLKEKQAAQVALAWLTESDTSIYDFRTLPGTIAVCFN